MYRNKLAAFTVAFLLFVGPCRPQVQKLRIFITGTDQASGNRSNVSAAEIGKSLDKHCPELIITIEQQKADYLMEAINTGAGAGRKPYKFTVFQPNGDRLFSTETSRLDSAVKDVCGYIQKHKN
jgi:hypothetical protein